MTSPESVLLTIRGLTKTFRQKPGVFARRQPIVRALDDVSLEIPRGSTIGVVGESGSGKSTLGRCLLRLIEPDAGTIIWHGQPENAVADEHAPPNERSAGEPDSGERRIDVTRLNGEDLRRFRRRMQVIFQDPFQSLNPARPVWQIVGEGLFISGPAVPESHRQPAATAAAPGAHQPPHSRAAAFGRDADHIRERAAAMLEAVGLSRAHLDRLPHEFSGGQRQRIAIARALIVEPEFLVCDEVTSALDTRTQTQVLALLRELQARTGVTLLFISHDLHTVAAMSREVVVMRAGRIVERGTPERLFASPHHDYTRELVAAVPNPDPRRRTFRPAASR